MNVRSLGRCIGSFALVAALALLFLFPAAAAETFPKPAGAVNDFAGVIPAEHKRRMEGLAEEVLKKTGAAIVVAAMDTIGDHPPVDYANRLYQAWGIGRKGEDKGVLIFLALKARQVRIETGYGVEGIIPDGLAGEILDRHAFPRFREGDYGRGLHDTMVALSRILAKEAGVTLDGTLPPAPRPVGTGQGPGFFQLLLFAAAAFFFLGTRRGRALLPWLLVLLMSGGGGGRRGGGFGGFGGGFGGFGGGLSGGGGAGRGF